MVLSFEERRGQALAELMKVYGNPAGHESHDFSGRNQQALLDEAIELCKHYFGEDATAAAHVILLSENSKQK